MVAWRSAKSLERLRTQINELAPGRSKVSDGTIGDAKHASRSSDHNPHIVDGKINVVSALDITHDPANGVDAHRMAEQLIASRDPRIKYVISNSRIASGAKGPSPWQWRPYKGSNPHTKHFHISVLADKSLYDAIEHWDVSLSKPVQTKVKVDYPLLKRGSKGDDVKTLQKLLGVAVDGKFGVNTENAVKKFQRSKKLAADGKVGPYTWEALMKTPENVKAANFIGGAIGGILLETVAKPLAKAALEKSIEAAGKAVAGKKQTPAKEIVKEIVEEVVEKKVTETVAQQVERKVEAGVKKELDKTAGQVDLGRYSKLVGALVGNIVAIAIAWFAVQFPAIATCAPGPDGTEACTVFGIFTQAQITGFLMGAFNMYFVYQFPANKPPA